MMSKRTTLLQIGNALAWAAMMLAVSPRSAGADPSDVLQFLIYGWLATSLLISGLAGGRRRSREAGCDRPPTEARP